MPERRLAVLVASNLFLPDETELTPLRCPPTDAAGLEKVLRDPARGGFDAVHLLVNRSNQEVAEKLNEVLNEATHEDLVLIYYSGHGKPNRKGDLFLATTNTRSRNLESTSVPVRTLRDYIESSYCRRIVLVLDCCFSGKVGDAWVKGGVGDTLKTTFQQGSGVCILTASTATELAQEKEGDTYSVFTGPLVQGLTDGSADLDGDGHVSVDELYDYIEREVRKKATQRPMKWSFATRGTILVARNPAPPAEKEITRQRSRVRTLAQNPALPDPEAVSAVRMIVCPKAPGTDAALLAERLADDSIGLSEFRAALRAPPPEPTAALPIRVLAIDGGGVRTLIPALILADLERRLGGPIHRFFDLVAGTSLGALLAMFVACPSASGDAPPGPGAFAEQIRSGSRRVLRPNFLSLMGIMGPKFDHEVLERTLRGIFGHRRLSESLAPLLVTSYEIERRHPFFFRSRVAKEKESYDFDLADVARAATALPMLFQPARISSRARETFTLVDAAVYLNNPAMAAYAEAVRPQRDARSAVVLSLGTGDQTRPISFDKVRDAGMAGWLPSLLDIISHGASSSVDYHMTRLLDDDTDDEPRYFRLQPVLPPFGPEKKRFSSDDVSPASIEFAGRIAAEFIAENSRSLDLIARRLTGDIPPRATPAG